MLKIFIIGMMIAIVFSLGSGLYYLMQDTATEKRTVKALTFRISLSLVLFLILLIGFATGVFIPHGTPT